MTNHAAFAHADLPLFMLHLLEFSGTDFEFDVEALNARWSNKDNIDSWSQMASSISTNVRWRPLFIAGVGGNVCVSGVSEHTMFVVIRP